MLCLNNFNNKLNFKNAKNDVEVCVLIGQYLLAGPIQRHAFQRIRKKTSSMKLHYLIRIFSFKGKLR